MSMFKSGQEVGEYVNNGWLVYGQRNGLNVLFERNKTLNQHNRIVSC